MKKWKYDLFNFKNSLTLDQIEISSVVENHLINFDNFSEKEITESLKKGLDIYTFDTDVKRLIEGLEEELEERPLVYDLKDLYKKVERKNYGMLYRDPLQKILDTISKEDDEARMESIVNELSLCDWVPEIKVFVSSLLSDPIEKQNFNNTGSTCESVYTIIESVEGGHVAYIGDRWFLLKEDTIEMCDVSEHVTDEEKLKTLQVLEKAMKISNWENDSIKFRLDENLSISISMDNKILLNDELSDKESTLEDLFNSPIVPFMKRDYYHVIESVSNNLDKVVDLDVVCKVSSLKKPMTETFAFNYKDKMFVYNVDTRTGSSLFEYDTVNQLIQDVEREMEYDLSNFFESKLSAELKAYKKLEDSEKEVELKIKDVNESIEELKENEELMNESKELKDAFDNLLIYKHSLTKKLNNIKNEKTEQRKRLS